MIAFWKHPKILKWGGVAKKPFLYLKKVLGAIKNRAKRLIAPIVTVLGLLLKRTRKHPREVVRRLFISCVLFTAVSATGLAIASGVKGAEAWKPCALKFLTIFCVGDVSLIVLGALVSIWSATWPE